MYYWFTRYSGTNWTPANGYNEKFLETVKRLRDWFGLSPEVNNPCCLKGASWQNYILQDEQTFVQVSSLKWDEYLRRDSEICIRFRLRISIRQPRTGKQFHNAELIIEFPSDYPSSPPRFYMEKYKDYSVSETHHMLGGGRLCVLTRAEDWRSNDTIISAVNVALNWMVWHYMTYGN